MNKPLKGTSKNLVFFARIALFGSNHKGRINDLTSLQLYIQRPQTFIKSCKQTLNQMASLPIFQKRPHSQAMAEEV